MPSHDVQFDAPFTSWACSCGEGGEQRPGWPAGYQIVEHGVVTTAPLLPLLRESQLVTAMRLSVAASRPHSVAAVELLIGNGFWLHDRRVRTLLRGGWDAGRLTVRVDWTAVAQALGVVDEALRTIKWSQARPEWMADVLDAWSGMPDPETAIPLTESEASDVMLLRYATSIAGGMPVTLSNLGSHHLDPHDRELVMEAIQRIATNR
ncbi:hypothetical protein ACQP00_21840 [Dactylosporangium sp. CS-047395]|uniref:hypothetical protein n=1 Tax=Dactylosporangium sp. CS-047395 TaxID=3239936 RepID=UPI003D9333A3